MAAGKLAEDRVAIITGAGRGLGREHALLLAAHGAKVLVNDLGADPDGTGSDAGPANEVAALIRDAGGEAIVNGANVADFEAALRQKKVHKRERFLKEVFRECKPGTSYAKKNTYLEERIELNSKYFGYMHDLKHKNKDMQQIRKDLFKMTR